VQTADGSTVILDAVTPRLCSTPGDVSSLAPQPGDHTDQVLREILHMEQTTIDLLRREGVIA
jgi:crotonobetainyl-CoA:carnitine CoA-transferase CaiB-like acyl-CoA transferase